MSTAFDGTRWIYAFYLILLVWVPVPLGSNRSWSGAVLEIWVFVLALAWLAGHIRGKYVCPPTLRKAWPMLICAGAWLGYVWLQLVPLPIEFLQLLSPNSARWHAAAAAPGILATAPLTLDRHATIESACKSTAYVVFFALSVIVLSNRDRIRFATYALIASGVMQALYGTFSSLQNPGEMPSGTFVNRNHYAAYLVMCLSVGIGVLMASLTDQRHHSWGHFFRNLIQWAITPKMGLRLLLVTMVIALVLTRSRMGNSAFFVSLFVAGVAGLVLSRRATRPMTVLLISLIVIDVFIIGAYFGTQRVIESIGQTTLQSEDRDEVAAYAIRMWRDYPIFGSGLGSFPVVFPGYSAQGTLASYTHAHNDYLELGAEVGLVGLGLLGSIVVMSLWTALRAQYLQPDPVLRGVSFAAIMGIVGLMTHSLADFNLQIPANALTFMQLIAFAWISRHYAATKPN